MNWTLYRKSGEALEMGEQVTTSRGEPATLTHGRPPHKPSSQGFVTVRFEDGTVREYYASVIDAEWRKEEP